VKTTIEIDRHDGWAVVRLNRKAGRNAFAFAVRAIRGDLSIACRAGPRHRRDRHRHFVQRGCNPGQGAPDAAAVSFRPTAP
jgi:hypothetical protein